RYSPRAPTHAYQSRLLTGPLCQKTVVSRTRLMESKSDNAFWGESFVPFGLFAILACIDHIGEKVRMVAYGLSAQTYIDRTADRVAGAFRIACPARSCSCRR